MPKPRGVYLYLNDIFILYQKRTPKLSKHTVTINLEINFYVMVNKMQFLSTNLYKQ